MKSTSIGLDPRESMIIVAATGFDRRGGAFVNSAPSLSFIFVLMNIWLF